MRRCTALAPALAFVASLAVAQVNPDAAVIAEFQRGVADYVALHKKVQSELPIRPTKSAHAIAQRQLEFARRIRATRAQAKQGNLFTPSVAMEFRRLIQIAMGVDSKRIQASLQHAEPVHIAVAVNHAYPSNVPLQSTPPSLLANLPALPPGLDYRIVGTALVLRDIDANLIIDFVPNALS